MPDQFLPCHICGYPRKFLHMNAKMGRDERLAQWPEYERCPNLDNPIKHPKKQHRGFDDAHVDDLVKHAVKQAVAAKSLPKGVMYMVGTYTNLVDGIKESLIHFVGEKSNGILPKAIGLSLEDAKGIPNFEVATGEEEPIVIPIWPLKQLTEGYKYVLMVLEGETR